MIDQSVWQQAPIRCGVAIADNVAVASPGTAILITASVAGEVTLTLANGTVVIVTVAAGDNIYPFACALAHATGATVTRMYNLSP